MDGWCGNVTHMGISDRLTIALRASLTGNGSGDVSAIWRYIYLLVQRVPDRPAIAAISIDIGRGGLFPNYLASP